MGNPVQYPAKCKGKFIIVTVCDEFGWWRTDIQQGNPVKCPEKCQIDNFIVTFCDEVGWWRTDFYGEPCNSDMLNAIMLICIWYIL